LRHWPSRRHAFIGRDTRVLVDARLTKLVRGDEVSVAELTDARPCGAPAKFTPERVCQIIALPPGNLLEVGLWLNCLRSVVALVGLALELSESAPLVTG
jgi:hypothetical protein